MRLLDRLTGQPSAGSGELATAVDIGYRPPEGEGCGVGGAVVSGRTGPTGARTRTAVLGKLNAPARSSITFTWQVYCPGFRSFNGTSDWNAIVLRAASGSLVAFTPGVSDT